MLRYASLTLLLMLSAIVDAQTIHSPNGQLTLKFTVQQDSVARYELTLGAKEVVLPSRLGLSLKAQPWMTDLPVMTGGFVVAAVESSVVDNSWEPVWGEVKTIRNNYRELKVTLRQPASDDRTLVIVFRLFDDGLGFRYEIPRQPHLGYFIVNDEYTEFHMTGDHKAFWIPGDFDTNEYAYYESRLSEVNVYTFRRPGDTATPTVLGANYVQTPLMMKSADGLYLNVFEAAVVNYPGMAVRIDQKTFVLTTVLAPDAVGNKAYLQTPARTPWRTVIVSKKAADILSSHIILNLNEPSVIKDPSWITPMKFVGVWWEMHVGMSSWNYADTTETTLTGTDWVHLRPNGKHGATTARTKAYIDFAAKHGIDGVLVEGWNIGWEDWHSRWKEEVFDFVTPYPDFNVEEVQAYAASKGVKMIMHHETSASATNYERRIDTALKFMKDHNYHAVKTGYVGRIIPRGEVHDGQWMVNHYVRVAQKMADQQIMLDAHEPIRPTGLQRTYPNWMACEAARGNEYNGWSIGNRPNHETILPFTRLLGGPMDYTPGIFQIPLDYYSKGKKERVHTTLTKQLALYVTLYSPIQMAADLPENYEKHLDAFQFIKDVAVDWDDTKILEAEPGEYLTIVRLAKHRDNEWFLGAITGEKSRDAKFPLAFLPAKTPYVATVYADGADAQWERNPMSYTVRKYLVTSSTKMSIHLAEGGGAAVSFRKATVEEVKTVGKY